MKQFKLSVSPRTETGRGPMRRLRAAGSIPAVVYGQSGVKPLSVKSDDFRQLMRSVGGSAALVEVNDGQSSVLTVIQDSQRDPCTDKFLHIDFQEVSQNKPMQTTLPVHLQGESTGVKNEGGLLEFSLHTVGVRCLPKDLPECINVDITELAIGKSIHIKDLPALAGVDYLGDPELTVVACASPKLAVEETPAAEGDAAEGEEKKEEGDASEAPKEG